MPSIPKKASPKDLIWAGSVQWESGSGSPTYAYVFGLDNHAVDQALRHLQNAVVKKEFQENHAQWVPWLGQSKDTSPEEIFAGIDESIKIRGPSRHQLDEMWFENAHMPEVLARIETEPLVVDLPGLSFDDLAQYCKQPEAIRPFVIGSESSLQPESVWASSKKEKMNRQADVLGEFTVPVFCMCEHYGIDPAEYRISDNFQVHVYKDTEGWHVGGIGAQGMTDADWAPRSDEEAEALYRECSLEFTEAHEFPSETIRGARTDEHMKRTAEVLEQGRYVTLERLPNGDLKMVATDDFHNDFLPYQNFDPEAYAEDERWGDNFDYYTAIGDLIEDIVASSNWSWVAPESIGALTDAPIITDDMDYSDEAEDEWGNPSPHRDANIWWYPSYAIRSFIDDLIKKGETIFTYAPSENEEPVQASTKQPESRRAHNKESTMTRQRKPPTPRRRTMRRRAGAKEIRRRVRERLERRAEARRPSPRRPERRVEEPRRRPAPPRPRRRMTAARLDEMRREKSRRERLAQLRQARVERQEREERMTAVQERREARERRAKRVATLERIREARARREAAAATERAPVAPPAKKKTAAATAQPKKRIYVKANNSGGVPEGYYELDEKATRLLQAQMKQKKAAAKAKKPAPSSKKGKKARKPRRK